MKKILLTAAACFLFTHQKTYACAGSEPDFEYFNLFAQEIIHNKEYEPFLLTYSNPFYSTNETSSIPDENIENWLKYFNNQLTYEETQALVYVIQAKHFTNWAKGNLSHQLFQKLGKNFFTQYREGLQYLAKAKELEPYMRINFVPGENSFYYNDGSKEKNATQLNYAKTITALQNAYKATTNKEIKLRYAYQIVRFNHYTRNYKQAISAFNTLVAPLQLRSPMYYYALDQMAGAQRGLNMMKEANWNFFQVFMHSRNRKQNAYTSMRLSNNDDFKSLLSMAKTPEEKNMAYFLLAYNDFGNPVPLMEKMLANNAQSEILKVLAARAINQMERSYLPTYPYCYDQECDKIKDKRLPLYFKTYYKEAQDYSKQLEQFVAKAKQTSKDEFWQLSEAYLKFLNKDYTGSDKILNQIKTNDTDYQKQITQMKMLNEVVSQPKITAEFEETLMKKYGNIFTEKPVKKENLWYIAPSVKEFLTDILANRYFLEHEDAKSFLLNNKLSDLQYNPNSALVKQVENFYRKTNKTSFEKYIAQSMDDVGDTDAFFNVIYGDRAMRMADFATAKSLYEKAKNFTGIPRYQWNDNNDKNRDTYKPNEYNGYNNISSLVFGHNIWESYESPENVSMKAANLSDFPFIKSKMTKLELADALLQLQKIGGGQNTKATLANQLIGNMLYNTSILGYYRHIFVMDIDNSNGGKFYFYDPGATGNPYHFYYKEFLYGRSSFIEPDNFDLAIGYYQKALNTSKDDEQKARILFQMASAEQGKYYQWEVQQVNNIKYDDKDYTAKQDAFQARLDKTKNEKFRTAFARLKTQYAHTQTMKDLQSSCLYFGHYVKK